ncbi:hypothetical protein DVH21_01820 [Micromonospora aurantiaca]|uniref:Uncharacterized protein n=2 Tax=Micromonospora aurantiaca (nom. illeg.) TaxID=47850 RepID=A0A6N3JUR3_9ACTN|nr:hypothetical protein DVH21_01820 [Micromonospora aurantiaca]
MEAAMTPTNGPVTFPPTVVAATGCPHYVTTAHGTTRCRWCTVRPVVTPRTVRGGGRRAA